MNPLTWLFSNTVGRFKNHSVTVNWNPEPEATSFQVWRRRANKLTWTKIGSTATAPYVDTLVLGGYTYFYEVYAFGPTGLKSTPSVAQSAVIPLW